MEGVIDCEFYKFAFLPHSYQCAFLVFHGNVQCATNVLVQSYVPSFLPWLQVRKAASRYQNKLQRSEISELPRCLPAGLLLELAASPPLLSSCSAPVRRYARWPPQAAPASQPTAGSLLLVPSWLGKVHAW